ncbi:hypothetical protein CLV78_101842 [Aliiruegeria haliotis]|uniref:DUF6314 domain-containing protein n=1 Tax=Aliiruegeria haliotis TaxID=1280846 RepID=A0A2T0RZX5_9RHOB|nr:DUF6314 family protein [Aliiruegeria haliotis]PRY26741.1 hypothetical protein CLV78_101842 [Aliiruegeria haliotis]
MRAPFALVLSPEIARFIPKGNEGGKQGKVAEQMTQIDRLELADLSGTWILDRDIADARTGQRQRLTGTAEFAARDGGLDYFETGRLVLPGGQNLTATRRYLWRVRQGGRVEVLFEDGRYFHSFTFGEAAPKAHHWCDPDDYRVSYDFSAWPVWSSRWSVNGPRKEYVMYSRYSRS